MTGTHAIKLRFSSQREIALRFAEAEFSAPFKATCQAISVQSMAKDFGINFKGRCAYRRSCGIGVQQPDRPGQVDTFKPSIV